jgi:hypothetical protein
MPVRQHNRAGIRGRSPPRTPASRRDRPGIHPPSIAMLIPMTEYSADKPAAQPRHSFEVELTFGEGANTKAIYNGEVIAHSRMPIALTERGGAESDMIVVTREGRPVARHPLKTPINWKSDEDRQAERRPIPAALPVQPLVENRRVERNRLRAVEHRREREFA